MYHVTDTSAAVRLEKLVRQIPRRTPLAVILGSSIHGLSYVRSLGRRRLPILVLDSRNNVATYSRYGKSCLLPRVEESSSDWLSFLELLGSRLDVPGILFPTSDAYLLFLSRNREKIERYFRFLIPDSATIEQIINKRSQYGIAEQAGIPVPKTVYPDSVANARFWASELRYPCILKPYMYRGKRAIGRKAIMVESPSQLAEQFGRVTESGHEFMVQEFIPGSRDALCAYHGFWDHDGKERAWWTKRHLRGGNLASSSYHVTIDLPEVAELSRRLLAAFSYKGFSHVEFKLDSRDNVYRLMEVNARSGMSNQQGITAGVDLPWLGYLYLTGADAAGVSYTGFKAGIKYVNEETHFATLFAPSQFGLGTLIASLKSFFKADAKATWAWDDPLPLVTLARELGTSRIGKRFKRARVEPTLKNIP